MNIPLFLIYLYKKLSFWTRSQHIFGIAYTTCKFYPSCSEYAEQAIQKHGSSKGAWKAVGRLARCHPFAQGGVDYP